MRKLHIDIETFCDLSIKDVGVYRYASHPSFKIILFCYRWDDGPEVVVDLYSGEEIPADVWDALTDPTVQKWAHNANFEFVCISLAFLLDLIISQWRCTMVAAAYLGLPLGLGEVSRVLGLIEKKDTKGKALISFFCQPCKPTKKNGGATVNLPADYPEKWDDFKGYNAQDVRVECEIEKYILKFPGLSALELEYWYQDQVINARGITIDVEYIRAAIRTNTAALASIHEELIEISGVDNPNSPTQLKDWLKLRLGHPVASIGKEYLAEALNNELLPDDVARVLELRQLGSRTSTSKYDTMLAMRGDDNRIRGLIQFYGANRTGRYSGRGVQPQNLKKTFSNADLRKKAPHLIGDGLAVGKLAVIKGVADLLYDDVPGLISQLVRTCLVAAPGKLLVVSDFAAIEGRVLAWIAGEEWALDVYRTHGKIYEATAANMFNVPISMVTKGSDLRAKGKVATLALGYQGAVGALITMGALREGLQEAELPAIVSSWRAANPKTVKLWRRLEDAARHVIDKKTKYTVKGPYCDITYSYEKGYLFCTLPSGRRLAYYGAHLDGRRIRYWGLDQVKKIWVKMDAYGGLLAENVTQAIARDILAGAMYNMRDLDILLHIHDEIVAEADEAEAPAVLDYMNDTMSKGPAWAADLPLKGDGYINKFYKKD